jgi:plastocyanin
MYQIACTMHPWTVGKVYTDPTEANTTATVLITNFAFYPPIVHIAPGGTVTFVNRDTTSHTAYGMAFVPVGTILPLTDASGTISVATAGRYDLTLAIADGHGQMATATHSLEVADHVPASIKEFNFSGTYGSPAAVQGGMLLQAKPQNFTFHVPAVSTLYANSTQGSATSHGTLQFAIVASDGQTLFRGSSMHGLVEPGVYTLEVNSSDPLIVSVPWTSHIFLDMMPAAESARSM